MAERFERRIEDFVERQLEQALSGPGGFEVPTKLAVGGLTVAGATLVILALVVVAIVLLVKLAF